MDIGLKPKKFQKLQTHKNQSVNFFTVSFNHGTDVRHGHNVRDPKIVEHEKHIDPEGQFEIWKDVPIAEAYEKLFGKAVREYNSKQKRSDRKINSYLDSIRKDKYKNECYEFIAQIGNAENQLSDKQEAKKLLKIFYKNFEKNNPHLKVIGAYFHGDEKTPHIHIDYIPVASGFKKGLSVQNSLTKALKQQGYENKVVEVKETDENGNEKIKKKLVTAEMQWQEKQRNNLQKLCEAFGHKIIQPERKPEEYEDSKILKKARYEQLISDVKIRQSQKKVMESAQKLNDTILEKKGQLKEREEQLNQREEQLNQRQKEFENEVIFENFNEHLSKIFGENFEQFSQVEKAIRENKKDRISQFQSLEKNCTNLFEKVGYALKKHKAELHDFKATPIDTVIQNLQDAKALGYKTYGEFLQSDNNAVNKTKGKRR